jgi:hypothetical protein
LKVECPPDATKDTRIPIVLRGTSNRSRSAVIEDITKTDELIIIVGEQNEVQLKIEDSTKYVNPNGTVEFLVQITNLGNKDVINVLLTIEGKIPGWGVKFKEEPIPVYQGQTKTEPILISAPGYAKANQKLVLNVVGVIEGATNYRSAAPLTVIVNHVYDFDAVVIKTGTKETVDVDPGKTVKFRMQVSNQGNGEDEISPSAYEILLDWNLTFYNLEGFLKYSFTLDYDVNNMIIEARLKIPDNTRTGDYIVGVNLSGQGSSKVVYVKVHVNQTFDLRVTTVDNVNNLYANIRPDQEKPFIIKVANLGNGLERVVLRLGSQYDEVRDSMDILHDAWEGKFVAVANTPDFTTNIRPYDFRDPIPISNLMADVYYTPNFTAAAAAGSDIDEIREITIVLDKGQTSWVHLSLRASRFESESDDVKVDVAGRGVGGPKDWNKTTLHLTVLFPDIEFVGEIEFSGGNGGSGYIAQVGEVVTIIVKVKNTGDIPAENVDVRLKIDNVEKKTSTLRAIKNSSVYGDDVKTVIFTWVAESGEHKVKVEIDPENTIIESPGGELDNNVIEKTVDVQGSFLVKELVNDYPMVSTMLILLLAIVVLVGAALLLKTNKKI